MKIINAFFLLMLSTFAYAENYYLDLNYKSGNLILPEKSSGIVKFFTDDDKSLIVTATVITKRDGVETIIVPPVVLERFEIKDDKLTRVTTEDIRLIDSYFNTPNQQVLIKVDFFSVDKSDASSFTKSLLNMAKAYSAIDVTPGVSDVAQSAIDTISSVLIDNKDVTLTYKGGVNLNKGVYQKSLYFDNSGKINELPDGDEDTAATVVFDIKGYDKRNIFFDVGFKEQVSNENAHTLYDNFIAVDRKKSKEKQEACFSLLNHLKKSNTLSSANDLLAIAINDSRWPQDETKNACLSPEIAINYRNQNNLHYIVNCVRNTCMQTKRIIIVSGGVTDFSTLLPFTGGVDLTGKGCFNKNGIKSVYSWIGFSPDYSLGAGFDAYKFTTCMNVSDRKDRYEHTIAWYDGKVFSHACEVIQHPEKSCF